MTKDYYHDLLRRMEETGDFLERFRKMKPMKALSAEVQQELNEKMAVCREIQALEASANFVLTE
mgnify:CR=1 FL=1